MKKILKRELSIAFVLLMLASIMIPAAAFAAKRIKAKSVSISAKSVVLAEGDVVTLTAQKTPKKAADKLKWSSSNKNVTKVSAKGVVTAVKSGTATITVKASISKKKASCKVTVRHYMTAKEVSTLIDARLTDGLFATLSDVDDKIAEKLAELGLTAWEDGTELKMHKQQQLPLTLRFLIDPETTGAFDITEVSFRKYHNDDLVHNVTETGEGGIHDAYSYKPIRLEYTIKGNAGTDIGGLEPIMRRGWAHLSLRFWSSDRKAAEDVMLDKENWETVFNDDNTFSFTKTGTVYLDTDADSFLFTKAHYSQTD